MKRELRSLGKPLAILAAGLLLAANASAQTFSCDKINSMHLEFDPPSGFSHRLVVNVDQWVQCAIPTPSVSFEVVPCGTTTILMTAGQFQGCITVQAGTYAFDFDGPPGVWCIRTRLFALSPNQWQCTSPNIGPVDNTAGTAVYCTAQVNSQGCTPVISTAGAPSATAGSGFLIGATELIAGQSGLLFYSLTGPASLPFGGGTLCVDRPHVRTAIQDSGGNGGCDGVIRTDFNLLISSGSNPGLVAGESVWAQYWTRDPAHVSGFNLTSAVAFLIGP